MDSIDPQQKALNARVAQKKWCRMVELPGYTEWSAKFHGLERIISNLQDYHVLAHPDEFSRPLDWLFERKFHDWLSDYADHGAPVKTLDHYRKPEP